ncbi:hypothetical protein L1887_31389 [Cichorium endivia]|nr:hypothetical protein L1887_31389 [Cichorium endivia]
MHLESMDSKTKHLMEILLLEGFEPPTPWFVATCSDPLSYRPHSVSTGSVPGSTLKKEPLLSPAMIRHVN